jgi:predicted TIM-barrel fold metal-dependent hydrolase
MTSTLDGVRPDMPDVKVVDADTHLTEVHDLWTSRAPAALKDRMPHVEQVDGEATWVVEGNVMGRAGAGGVVDKDNNKGRSFEALYEWEIDRIHQGAYDPVARLEMMDEAGVDAQVVFPNTVGLGGQGLSQAVLDPELRLLCIEMYNDSNAEMQEASRNRLLPMAVLPAWDIDACVREAQRCAAMDMRGVNITSDPQDQDAPDLANRAWDPLWEACATLSLPLHFHIGGSLTVMTFFDNYAWPSHDDDTQLAIQGSMLFIGNSRVIVNIICSGMLERHPELKVVSVESGAGWVPFTLEALDYEMTENAPRLRNETLSMSPSEYFKRQIYATMWFERTDLPSLVRAVGEDNILFETDFPHPTCLYPDPLTSAQENMRELTAEQRSKILGGNAAKLYRL